ncbi:MAG: hypothetical protein ACO4AJ_15355, partial [Prochlorothrix sp.]
MTTGNLSSGSTLNLTSAGAMTTGNLSSGSTLNLTSAGAMTTGNLSGSAITANSGTTLVAANINALGPINLSSTGDLVTGNLYTPGQAINLTSTTGSITTGNAITASSTGGSIFYNARTAITAGTIDSSGSVGSGGNVKLDPIGDIQVVSINTQGGVSGTGGNIDIAAGRFFRAIGSFIDRSGQEASISARGGTGGGTITIRHGGGNLSVPFVTGDTTLNGTRAGLVTGFGRMASDVTILGPLTESGVNLITAGVNPTTLSLCTTGCQGLQGLAPMQESQSLLLLAAAFQESLLGTAPSSSDAATSGDATSTPATTGTVGDTGSIATATDSQASTATGSTATGSTAAGSTATGSTAAGSTATGSTASPS